MKNYKNLLIVLISLGIIIFLAYSLLEYRKSGIAEEGLVTCADEQCFWSSHIHIYAPIQICGEKYALPKFKGPLSGLHTHADENIIHWHDKVIFDAEKKQPSEPTPFALNLIFKTLELPITEENLLNKKNGDMCRNSASTWKIFVNVMPYPDWRNYEWRDQDIIFFVFDERTVEDVEKELRQNPIKFPALGEG
ncbi:MAG: hypothetical protein G01um101424_67 [Parcubacteria group bacterium Gr01-1014_24]|nr:MAG: hypothetical protein G01um101424_67 [Parcubacteria group bacterium Gr01-1014_24]